MIVVAILTIRAGELERFRSFERLAAHVMRRHGGAIERTVVVPPGGDQPQHEVHLLSFPDEAAFVAYRNDPELLAAAPLREASVLRTQLLFGEPGPDYREE